MPTVPLSKQSVNTSAGPNPQLTALSTPNAYGAEIGTTTERAGLQVIQEERRRADDMAHMTAVSELRKFSTALLYDPKNGMLSKRGSDAFDVTNTGMEMFDKRASEIESNLAEESQKEEFRKSAYMLRGDADVALQRHVYQEIRGYDQSEMKAFMGNSAAAVAGAVTSGDFSKVGFEIGAQQTELAKYASRNGLGAEWLKQSLTDSVSGVHLTVIETLAAGGNDQLAKKYYDQYKTFLTGNGGADNIKAEKLVGESSVIGESQRIADKILGNHDPETLRQSAYDEAKAVEDPKVRDAVVHRLDTEFIRQDRAKEEVHHKAQAIAIDAIEGGTSVSDLPPDVMSQLSVGDRASLRAYDRATQKGEKIETVWPEWYKLMDMASEPSTRAAFVRTNLMAYRDKLGDAQFTQIVTLQASLRGQDTKKGIDDEELTGYRTNKQIVDDTLTSLGFDTTPKAGSTQSQDVAKFRRTVDEQIVNFKAQHNRKPNFGEVEDIVDMLVVKGRVPKTGVFIDKQKFAFQLEGDEELAVSIKDIPKRQVDLIQQRLIKDGNAVTNDRIIAYYNTRLKLMLRHGRR